MKKILFLLSFIFYLNKSYILPSPDLFNLNYSKELLNFSEFNFLQKSKKIKNLNLNLKKNLKNIIQENNILLKNHNSFKKELYFFLQLNEIFEKQLNESGDLSIWSRGCFSINFSEKAKIFLKKQNFKIEYQLFDQKNLLETLSQDNNLKIFKFLNSSSENDSGFFILKSYIGNQLIDENNLATNFTGDIFTIFFNKSGINKAGNPFGLLDSVSVTRVYPKKTTFSETIDINNFEINSNQFWKMNIIIDLIFFENNEILIPKIDSIELSKNLEDVFLFDIYKSDFNNKKININLSNLSGNNCYPNINNKAFWKEILK